MKKCCKILMIIMYVIAGIFLAGLIVCIIDNEDFGMWLLDKYENITTDYGHTVEGMYRKGANISIYGLIIFGCLGIIFMLLMLFSVQILKLLRIYARSDDDLKIIKEEEKNDKPDELSVSDAAKIAKKLEKAQEKAARKKARIEAREKKLKEQEAKLTAKKTTENKEIATTPEPKADKEQPKTQINSDASTTPEIVKPVVKKEIPMATNIIQNPVDDFLKKFKK